MQKTFCDFCGDEIGLVNSPNKLNCSHNLQKDKVGFSISYVSAQDICLYCVLKKLNELDKRPKAEVAKSE